MTAIASCAGEEWLSKAIAAALKLSESTGDKASNAGNELLSDIQAVFENKKIERISTVDLIILLCDDEEAPWATYNRGKPIVPRQLVKQLAAYEIKPKQIRLNSQDRIRGFELLQFNDSFKRYLTIPNFACDVMTKQQESSNDEACAVTKNVTPSHIASLDVTANKLCVTSEATSYAACHTVTDKTAFLGAGEERTDYEDSEVF